MSIASLIGKLQGLARGRKTGRFCALDFDREQLRVVLAESTGERTRIIRLATAEMPGDLDLTDARAVGDFLGRTLNQMRLRSPAAVMNVSRGQAVLKPLVLPPVSSAGELASMVLYQAEKELTFPPEEAVVDFTLESHYGAATAPADESQGQHVLVAAVQRPVIEYYKKIAETAKVRLLRLGLRPYADLRCVEAYGSIPVEGRVAVVHVMADETEIDVIDSGGLAFSRSAAVAVPLPAHGEAVASRAAAQAVVMEVARSLHSYMGVERGQTIDLVLLAGGTGIEREVAEELAKRLGVRCEMLSPAERLGLEDSGLVTSAFISPLGQAAGYADTTALPFDFLHPKRPPVKRDMNKVMALGAVSLAACVVVGMFAFGAIQWYRADSFCNSLAAELARLTEENRRVAALAKRTETITAWVHLGRDWLDQWAYLSNVFPSCTEVYITNLKTTMANTANPNASVSFTVKAKSNEAINELGKRLEAAGYAFKPGQVTNGTDAYGYTYSTSVTVMVKPEMKVDLAGVAPAPRPADDAAHEQFGKPRPASPPAVPPVSRPVAGRSGVTPAATMGAGPGMAPRVAAGEVPTPAATSGEPTATSSTTAGLTPYKEWAVRYEQFLKTRPPEDGPVLDAWRATRAELRQEGEALRRQEAASSPAQAPTGRRRHE